MSRRLLNTLSLSAMLCMALMLSACGKDEAPATPTATPAPVAAPAQSPSTATEEVPAPSETTPTEASDTTSAEAVAQPIGKSADVDPQEMPKTADTPVVPEGQEPRLGTDYQVIEPAQTMTSVPGKVEIAEVFSYTCIHCARLDALMPAWKKTLPPQVNVVYAPMSHGGFEPIARLFYAAQAMGVQEKTHSGMFKALAEQQKFGSGRLDDIAKLYGDLGVDVDALKATASSFAVNTQISRSQRTLARWAIEGTPTMVVAGKYRVVSTADRGHEGMLQAARWLAQREIAEQQNAAK